MLVIILIIAIPTFFILRWGLSKFIKNERIRNWSVIIGTLIAIPILYFGVIITFFSYLFYEPQYDFDREKWFADKQSRFEMRDNIIASGMLKKKSKLEVRDFIGYPELGDSTNIWIYDLGMSSAGFGWQFNSLELTFKNDKVIDVKKIEIID